MGMVRAAREDLQLATEAEVREAEDVAVEEEDVVVASVLDSEVEVVMVETDTQETEEMTERRGKRAQEVAPKEEVKEAMMMGTDHVVEEESQEEKEMTEMIEKIDPEKEERVTDHQEATEAAVVKEEIMVVLTTMEKDQEEEDLVVVVQEVKEVEEAAVVREAAEEAPLLRPR